MVNKNYGQTPYQYNQNLPIYNGPQDYSSLPSYTNQNSYNLYGFQNNQNSYNRAAFVEYNSYNLEQQGSYFNQDTNKNKTIDKIDIFPKDLSPCSNLDLIFPDLLNKEKYTDQNCYYKSNKDVELPSCSQVYYEDVNASVEKQLKSCQLPRPSCEIDYLCNESENLFNSYSQSGKSLKSCFVETNQENYSKYFESSDITTPGNDVTLPHCYLQSTEPFIGISGLESALNDSDDESDIIVEDCETSDQIKNTVTTNFDCFVNCYVCNSLYNVLGHQIYLLTTLSPVTVTSQTPIYAKLQEITGENILEQSYVCNECINVLNNLDHLFTSFERSKNEFLIKYQKAKPKSDQNQKTNCIYDSYNNKKEFEKITNATIAYEFDNINADKTQISVNINKDKYVQENIQNNLGIVNNNNNLNISDNIKNINENNINDNNIKNINGSNTENINRNNNIKNINDDNIKNISENNIEIINDNNIENINVNDIRNINGNTITTINENNIKNINDNTLKNINENNIINDNTIETINDNIKNINENKINKLFYKNKNLVFKNRKLKCKTCLKIISLNDVLKKHCVQHKNKLLFCDICKLTFHCSKKFIFHKKLHLKLKQNLHKFNAYLCKFCKKPFRRKSHLNDHENICSGNLPFSCKHCEKKFPTISKLKLHVKSKHEKKFVSICSICNVGFVKASDYKAHISSHSNDKKFNCSKCDKQYKTLSNLNFHLKFHENKLPFSCSFCGKGFMRKEYLEAHVNNHEEVKNFTCNYCEKKFVAQKNLDAHLKYHDGNYTKKTCKICKKTVSSGMEEHIRTHNNLREFECELCLMRFNTKGALAKHKKRKH